jgi:hypothetical protein
MVPENLDKVAGTVCNAYIARRRATYPRYMPNSKNHGQLFWRRVAMIVVDNDLDPVYYVQVLFEEHGDNSYANILLSANMLTAYHRRVNNNKISERIEMELSLSIKKVRSRVRSGDKLDDVLNDERNSFDSVFIWCMAITNNLPVTAVRYRDSAARLLQTPQYREIYTKAFPGVICQ